MVILWNWWNYKLVKLLYGITEEAVRFLPFISKEVSAVVHIVNFRKKCLW